MGAKTVNGSVAAGASWPGRGRSAKSIRKELARSRHVDYLVYLAVRLGVMVLHMTGRGIGYALAGAAAAVIWRFDGCHRERALANLRASFPDWPEARVRAAAKASIRNMACMGLELFLTPRRIRPDTWRRYVRLTGMAEVIRMLVERKTPLVLVTGHFGNWELAGYFSSVIGLPTHTVARRIDNPYLNDFIFGLRERAGQTMIYKAGAGEAVQRALDRNEAVSIVCDQDAGAKGIFVDFFGRPASTFKSIGLMAMQFNAPVAVVCCRRLDRRFHFEVFCRRIIHPGEWSGEDDPLRWITREYTRALEEVVRDAPEQYFWVHRRWKSRPADKEPGDNGIA